MGNVFIIYYNNYNVIKKINFAWKPHAHTKRLLLYLTMKYDYQEHEHVCDVVYITKQRRDERKL